MSYDTVIISAAAGEYNQVAELQIFDQSNNNVALLGTATQGATFQLATADNVIDGDTGAEYMVGDADSNPVAIALPENDIVITLDRGYALSEFNRVVFFNRSSDSQRAIGTTITFTSTTGLADFVAGTCNIDLVQTFVMTLSAIVLSPRVSGIKVIIAEVVGSTGYRLTVQEHGTTTTTISKTDVTELTQIVGSLTPETGYTIELFADTGSGYTSVGTASTTTLANSSASYDTSDFSNDGGKFEFSSLGDEGLQLLLGVINDIFTTGDVLKLDLKGVTRDSQFVKRGEQVNVTDSEALLVPFDTSAGSGQSITMELTDTSTVSVAYNELTNAITVGGTEYAVNEHFVLDGKKVSVFEI